MVGTEAALLVDAGSSPEQGRLLRAAVTSVTPSPLTTVVLTHWHYDHAFGLPGTGADTGSRTSRYGSGWPARKPRPRRSGSGSIRTPSRFRPGGGRGRRRRPRRRRRVEAVHLGRGHTDGDLVVVVPGAQVVFAGDLLESSGPPQYGPDSFPHEWPATLDGLLGLTTDTTVVLPGHGGAMDREAVFDQRGRVAAVSGEITRLAGLGVGVEDAESRGDWALPFAAVRPGYEAGCAQVGTAEPRVSCRSPELGAASAMARRAHSRSHDLAR